MDMIKWLLGADSSAVRTEMSAAVRASQQGGDQIRQSWDKVEGGHQNLLRSSHRVSGQITRVSKDLLQGANAGDIFADSLEGISRSLNVSLGALAVLGVGAVVGQFMYKTIEDFEKLQKSLSDLHTEASKSGEWKTVRQLEEAAKQADEAVQKLQERISNREGGGASGIWQKTKDAVVDAWNAVTMSGGSAQADKAGLAGAKGDQGKIESDILNKRRQQTNLRTASLDGAPDYAIKAAQALSSAMEKPVKSFAELAQNLVELNLTLREITKGRNDKAMERSGMSLKEIAESTPDVVNNSVSYQQWKASQDAKKSLSLQAAGEDARINFKPEEAHANLNAAGEAAEGISNLKPSEKMSADFKGALSVTEAQLAEIAKNTAKQFVNQ